MAAHRDRLPLVQLGVGAAFDFHAGMVRQAPPALQKLGLEWAFRLAMEPRRLAKRYLRHNPRFVWHLGRQLWRERVLHRPRRACSTAASASAISRPARARCPWGWVTGIQGTGRASSAR
jgi:hypothetical protein